MSELNTYTLPIGTRIRVELTSDGFICYEGASANADIEASVIAKGWIGFASGAPKCRDAMSTRRLFLDLSEEQLQRFPYAKCYSGKRFWLVDPNACPQCGETH